MEPTTEILFSTAAVIGGLITIISALYSVYKVARKIDDAIGEDSSGRTISERIDYVESKLLAYDGKSLSKRIDKIETRTAKTSTEVSIIKDFLFSRASQEDTQA